MTATPQIAFSLSLPPSWSELDLRPATRDRSIATVVQERYRDVPELRERRADMTAYLCDTARAAWDVGCRYCGVFLEAADDGIVPGSITVSILPTPPTTGGSALDDIVTQLHTIDTAHNTGFWARTNVVTLKHAGDAARTWGIQPHRLSPRQEPVPVALMNTYVPFHGGVVLIAAGSPAAEVADPLFDLFDAVTDTFRLHPMPKDD